MAKTKKAKRVPPGMIRLSDFATRNYVSEAEARIWSQDAEQRLRGTGRRNLLRIYRVDGIECLSEKDVLLWRQLLMIDLERMRPDPTE